MLDHLQPAGDALAEEVTVVEPVLADGVLGEQLQVFLGQELTGKEPWPHKTLGLAEPATGAAAFALGRGAITTDGAEGFRSCLGHGAHADLLRLSSMKNQLSK